MKILITEEQKKNLFKPRNLENRDEQYKQQIKKEITKFLTDEGIDYMNFDFKEDELENYIFADDLRYHIRHYGTLVDVDGKDIYGSFLIDTNNYCENIANIINLILRKENPNLNWDDISISEINLTITSEPKRTTIKGQYVLYDDEAVINKKEIQNLKITI